MKSILNESKEVVFDGTEYVVEADVTIEGTELFRMTNKETDEVTRCRRKGSSMLVNTGGYFEPTEEMKNVLNSLDEVNIISK